MGDLDENDFEVIDIFDEEDDDDDDIEIIDAPDGGTKKKKVGKGDHSVASKINSIKNGHLYNIWKSSANYNE